ncbi:4'-phosphopantetheinyl transferase family protein [Rugosimonospora africana]|uniref:Putative 4'-phosphopantetheinyl transferase n=1 Tax=Rugosimonospora africana TaxID=556532 RepID=A0A8J3VVC7_9ACTN|nr:4'-phosphopantetheinyl transferase superfamily protein [Rugosimonospora africana]GIH19646.1 putative 4'-phosphopantetheinyl transferase [Rugosimonospora africana]
MIEALLQPPAVPVEAFTDIPGERPLPAEEPLIARAVESRRREFVTGRRCARQALARLGLPSAPVLAGARHEPRWPLGVVGSITHCEGYRAAAVARTADLAALGIDAEPHGPLPAGVLELVTTADEPDRLADLSRAYPATHWDRLLFSAKESVYKAWYPLTARWLGFEDARLSFDPVTHTFAARILVDGTRVDGGPPLRELAGRYIVSRGLVVTAVSIGLSA